MTVERKERKCGAGDKRLLDRPIMVSVPVLFMKGLLTAVAIPVSGRCGFYGVIPKLALLPSSDLVGGELGRFEGRGRVFGGASTFR